MLQAEEADIIDVDTAMRPQVVQLVGEIAIYNETTMPMTHQSLFVLLIPPCSVWNASALKAARCNGQPAPVLRRPALQQDVLIFNFLSSNL